jgi:hypothetical protein
MARVKNQWSPLAGNIGFSLTLVFASISDLPWNLLLRVLLAPASIVSSLFTRFEIVPHGWMLWALVLFVSLADALWFMIVAEVVRLSVRRIAKSD